MRIMHNYPQNAIFLDHNLTLYKMIQMHLKYHNMHTNEIFNALIFINNHVNLCINSMSSTQECRRLMNVSSIITKVTLSNGGYDSCTGHGSPYSCTNITRELVILIVWSKESSLLYLVDEDIIKTSNEEHKSLKALM